MLSDLRKNINRTDKFPASAVCHVTNRSEDGDYYVAVVERQGQWSVPALPAERPQAPQYSLRSQQLGPNCKTIIEQMN
jgi:hypothetical protein